GAEFQAKYAIGVAAARGNDQHWRLRARAQTAQHFNSAETRQREVEQDQGVIARRSVRQSLLSMRHAVDRKALRPKMFPHLFTYLGVIVNDQNLAPHLTCRPPRPFDFTASRPTILVVLARPTFATSMPSRKSLICLREWAQAVRRKGGREW